MLKALGVEILRAPNEVRPEAPESAYSVAKKLAEQLTDAVVMDEVTNLKYMCVWFLICFNFFFFLNKTKLRDLTAYHDLAEEILQQTKLNVDFVFVGVESGATLTGIAQYLKKKIPGVKVRA